jgi:hypothetical protein
MHVVVVLQLRLLAQEFHLVVDLLQRPLLRRLGPTGSSPAFACAVGRPCEVRHGSSLGGIELLEIVVAGATGALGFDLHELLLYLVGLVDFPYVLLLDPEG